MPSPAPALVLSGNQKSELEGLVGSGSAPQKVAVPCRFAAPRSPGRHESIHRRTAKPVPAHHPGAAGCLRHGRLGCYYRCSQAKAPRQCVDAGAGTEDHRHHGKKPTWRWQHSLECADGQTAEDIPYYRSPGLAASRCAATSGGAVQLSNDPRFEEKVRDIIGLCLNPPEPALVLCVDEKSQIQALDRTAPILPLRPGLPERQTRDYKR
jgi:hypothetical protein